MTFESALQVSAAPIQLLFQKLMLVFPVFLLMQRMIGGIKSVHTKFKM